MKISLFGGGPGVPLMVVGQDGSVMLCAGGRASYDLYLAPTLRRMQKKIDVLHVPHTTEDQLGGARSLVESTLAWQIADLHSARVKPYAPRPPQVRRIWFNTPTDYLGEFNPQARRDLESWIFPLAMDRTQSHVAARLMQFIRDIDAASRLRRDLGFVGIPVNSERDGELMIGTTPAFALGSLRVSVLAPMADDLRDAGTRWREQIRSGREIFAASAQRASLSWDDSDGSETGRLRQAMLGIASDLGRAGVAAPPAVLPLSILVSEGEDELLLPGPAMPSQVVKGLAALGWFDQYPTRHVAVIQMNGELAADRDFHRRIHADHYLFACDGSSPSVDILNAMLDARLDASPRRFVFHFNGPSRSEHEPSVEHIGVLNRWAAKATKKTKGACHARFLKRGSRLEVKL